MKIVNLFLGVLSLVALFLLLFVGGCSRGGDSAVAFTLDDVRTIPAESFQALDQIELGRPGRIVCWDENRVIVADRMLPSLLSLINIQTGEKRPFLKMGRGPGECLDVSCMVAQEDKLYAYSTSSKKIIVLRESDEADQVFSLVEEIPIKEACIRVIPTKDGGYIGTPNHDGRFYLFSGNGTVVDTLGSFPPVEGEAAAINNIAFQSSFAFSPDGKQFCSAFSNMDFIEIYSVNFKKTNRLWGPEPFLPRAVRRERSGLVSYAAEPHKQVYSAISATDKGFLVGYIGHLYTDRDDPARYAKDFLYFDWKGKLLARYTIPQELPFFDVDWENGRLFGVTNEAEPKLVLAELEGL